MNLVDTINGLFEFVGGLLLTRNCFVLYRDKEVKGVSWGVCAFMAVWGYWNLFVFYPVLNQWLSWAGALIIDIANTVWVAMAIYYQRRQTY